MDNLKGLVIDNSNENSRESKENAVDKKQKVSIPNEDSPAVRRLMSFILEKDWDEAQRIANRIEEKEKKNAKYWIARLMCTYKTASEEELARLKFDFSNNQFYKNALRFANGSYLETIKKISNKDSNSKDREKIHQLWNQQRENSGSPEAEIANAKKYRNLAYGHKISNARLSYESMAENYILAGDLDYAYYCYSRIDVKEARIAKEKIKSLKEFIENGVSEGRKNYRYFQGVIKKDEGKYEEAAQCFISSYNNGEIISANGMGMLYCFNCFKNLYPYDAEKAKAYFEEAYNYRADPFAAYQYALVWMRNETYDMKEVEKLFQKSFWWFDNGNAERYCGDLRMSKKERSYYDFEKAMEYYKAAIDKNNFDAMEGWISIMADDETPDDLTYKENWIIGKECCEKLFTAKRYATASVYAIYYDRNLMDGLFVDNQLRKAEILCKAADAGDNDSIYCYLKYVVQKRAPIIRSSEWIMQKIKELTDMITEDTDETIIKEIREFEQYFSKMQKQK